MECTISYTEPWKRRKYASQTVAQEESHRSVQARSASPGHPRRPQPGASRRDLGVCRSLLGERRRGIQEGPRSGRTGQRTFPGHGNPRDQEMAKRQKEDARLKQVSRSRSKWAEGNEILEKATGVFTDGAPAHQSRPRGDADPYRGKGRVSKWLPCAGGCRRR